MSKIEPRLAAAIEGQRRRAALGGGAAAEVDESQRFEVTISHQERLPAPADGRETGYQALKEQTQRSQRPLVERVQSVAGDTGVKQHVLTNAITARLTPDEIARVAELDEVEIVRLERLDKVTTMNDSVDVIEATDAWSEFGIAGRGVKVAVLDTGIDRRHPALFGKVVDEISTAGEGIDIPGDHATHCAGTIASNDPIYRGIAYEADLVNIKVLTSFGFGTPQSVIDGLEQAVLRGADVASLSLGWSEIYHGWVCNDADCILCQAADNAVRLGVTVVVAAGNEGTAAGPGESNIRHPGAARRVITVGAVDKSKRLAPFSSIGPSSGRLSPTSPVRLTKPDLAAPGVDIVSSVLGGGFASFNGTSMATPHVAAVAALLLERRAKTSPATVKKLLEDASERLSYEPDEVGYGLLNAMGTLVRTL